MSRGKRFRALIRSARFNLLMMALFLALSIVGMDILQRSLLANSQETGMSLAQSFSVEEERNIFAYETLMELESEYLESYLQEGASEEELQEWISSFYQNVNSVFDKTPIDPYAVVDGRVIAAQPWEGDEALDLESSYFSDSVAVLVFTLNLDNILRDTVIINFEILVSENELTVCLRTNKVFNGIYLSSNHVFLGCSYNFSFFFYNA